VLRSYCAVGALQPVGCATDAILAACVPARAVSAFVVAAVAAELVRSAAGATGNAQVGGIEAGGAVCKDSEGVEAAVSAGRGCQHGTNGRRKGEEVGQQRELHGR
jgi:hypothetical protein